MSGILDLFGLGQPSPDQAPQPQQGVTPPVLPSQRPQTWQNSAPLMALLPIAMAKGGARGVAALLRGYHGAGQEQDQRFIQQNQLQRQASQDQIAATERAQADKDRQAQLDRQRKLDQLGLIEKMQASTQGIDNPDDLARMRDSWLQASQLVGLTPDQVSPVFTVPPSVMETRAAKKAYDALAKQYKPEQLAQLAQSGATYPINKQPTPVSHILQLVNGGGLAANPATGQPIQPTVDKRGFATKDVVVNGKRMLAGYDPDTNTYYAPGDTKTPLSGNIQEYNKPSPVIQGMGATGPEDIADAIIRGDQPPTLNGLYRFGAPVRASLAQKGFNLAQAETDWKATQKHIATLNGQQQLRMQQAIDNAAHSLDIIDDLAAQWQAGRFPLLNRGRLAAAKAGAMNPQAQEIATRLDAQIADVTAELANVYMGGNSPTDHALGLAAKNLQAEWSLPQLKALIEQSRKNLQIRANSMKNVGVAGASAGNAYATPTPDATAPAIEEWVRDASGKLVKKGAK
jgi:hypothetical protein